MGAGGILAIIQALLGNINGALPQSRTNGNSPLGTFGAPTFPPFLTNNPLPNGYPWSSSTAESTNPYNYFPNTGVTRNYEFTVSRGVIAPDGYQRNVLLVNGAYPGPTIEANWGDMIQVTVNNNITGPQEGVSMHWHGFLQQGTPWEDGAPAISQCPIAPGKSFTYQIKASLYGTSWYHSHYSAQYSGGALGPIVIHGPNQQGVKYDIDIGPIVLSDWYHTDYNTLLEGAMTPNTFGLVFSDNNLINGKMNFDCSTLPATDKTPCTGNAGVSKFKFTTGKTHRLRLVNTGSDGTQRFSIDGHQLTVMAYDFVPIVPYTTKVVTLGVGQRADVLVTANAGNSKSSWWMRSNITSCSLSNQPDALAAVYYDQADETKAPTSAGWNVPDPGTCTNDDLSLTQPVYKMALPAASTVKPMPIGFGLNASAIPQWSLDGTSFRGDYNAPPLLLAAVGNTSFPAEWNVKNLGTNSSVRLVVTNPTPAAHPIHLHGFNMYVLYEGPGLSWDGTTVNAANPMRRDVQMLRSNGTLVVQFDAAQNPGVWPFHCHIAWHVSLGFFSQLLVEPAKVRQLNIPNTVAQTCRDWAAWTNTHVPDQIDSGL